MAGQKPKSARTIAIEALNQCNPKYNYAGPILNKLLSQTDQKQRATDLVLGTIRNRSAIDTVIATFSDRPVERIPDKLLNIIRIGAYELIYSPVTGQHAIVNEAVENTKILSGKKQVGFVNAVLRQITRHIKNRQNELSKSNLRRTLYQSRTNWRYRGQFEISSSTELSWWNNWCGTIGCEFDMDFMPDPESSPVEYFSTVFSLPKWLITDWLSEFGAESTRRICLASNRRPGIYLRPNSLKTTTQELTEKFQQADIDFEIVDVRCSLPDTPRVSRIENQESSMIRIKSPRAITDLPGFSEGLFTVQDITASQAVRMLDPQPNWTILDLCAAPGTKTTQLAESTGDSAKIIATDIDAERLKKVRENTTRLGIKSVEVVPYEELPNSKFDCVLLDVPCSNTGVLARRIEARYRVTPGAIKKLIKTQSELLGAATQMLKPHGKICYSTCSIQKDENSDLIRDFLQKNHNFELKSEKLILPSAEEFDHDGGYTTILVAT
ncbi:MAG TPA: transcription antitermination factor NusB [Sedimentisphaerales bacterium]|nr:transcription antitermination factor NusB [Sedimentisphaerales bacterium]